MKRRFPGRTDPADRPAPPLAASGGPVAAPQSPGVASHPVRWYAAPRARNLATAALLALLAVIVTGHVALVLLAAPALGALALMPRRRPAGELALDVALSALR